MNRLVSPAALQRCSARITPSLSLRQSFRNVHTSPLAGAAVTSFSAPGPPPPVPEPIEEDWSPLGDRLARRRAHAEALGRKAAKKSASTAAQGKIAAGLGAAAGEDKSSLLKRRFWKEVNVKKADDGYQVLLDSRPLRTPGKDIMLIPATKPHLATAIALEWEFLTSAQQAMKHHLIPLTSLTSRALDIADEDAATPKGQIGPIRQSIIKNALRYLDTDTLLCWAPENNIHSPNPTKSLRSLQERAARPIIDFLTTHVWPGVQILPVLEDSIIPRDQPAETKAAIEAWMKTLSHWDLAGLERGILAGKGLLGAARLVVEWSEHLGHMNKPGYEQVSKFGVEEAAQASSVEVSFQTEQWGEVEDTHDVEKEDLRRQLGSVVLLVSGVGK